MFAKFKNNYCVENYLVGLPPAKSIASLRLSTHSLEIEMGRYYQPCTSTPERRVCQQCSSGTVEDETHFLFKCQEYQGRKIQETLELMRNEPLNSRKPFSLERETTIYDYCKIHKGMYGSARQVCQYINHSKMKSFRVDCDPYA